MFKFDEFPEIKEGHKKFRELEKKSYELEEKKLYSFFGKLFEKLYEKKEQQAMNEVVKYRYGVYSKIIFDVFKQIKPKLTKVNTKETFQWNDIFDDDFAKLTNNQVRILTMLVEDERPYVLPEEYYNDIDRMEGKDMETSTQQGENMKENQENKEECLEKMVFDSLKKSKPYLNGKQGVFKWEEVFGKEKDFYKLTEDQKNVLHSMITKDNNK